MPDPGFKGPLSSSSSNSSDVQVPVKPLNTVFQHKSSLHKSSLHKKSRPKSARSNSVHNTKPNSKPISNSISKPINTSKRNIIITLNKIVNLEDKPNNAIINFIKNDNANDTDNLIKELQYQNKLQALDLAPKVIEVVSGKDSYTLADFLEKKIPITKTTNFYYESVICGKEIFDPTYGNYSEVFYECERFFYKIASSAQIILSDMKTANLCRDPTTRELKAIDFGPEFIIELPLIPLVTDSNPVPVQVIDPEITKSYVIFMLFQLYISLIFYGNVVIQFAETNISVQDFNKMLEDIFHYRKENLCLRNLYHYLGLRSGEYEIMTGQPKDEAIKYTKAYIRRQIVIYTRGIDIKFLHDTVTKPGGKRRFTRKQKTKKRRSAK